MKQTLALLKIWLIISMFGIFTSVGSVLISGILPDAELPACIIVGMLFGAAVTGMIVNYTKIHYGDEND